MRIQLLADWRMPMPTHLYAPTHAQGCRVAQLVKCLVTSGYPDGSSSGGPGSNPGEDENF